VEQASEAAEKCPFVRHSERSEESLLDLNPSNEGKEGFLASLGMTVYLLFSTACEACVLLNFKVTKTKQA
jgi:hypothetical protein